MPSLLSIIVPVYNESATIGAVIDRLLTIDLPVDREIIVVNDGSTDGTREVLDKVVPGRTCVSVVHLPENRGKGHALRVGLSKTRGTITAIQDADLELDPAQLKDLVQPVLIGLTDASGDGSDPIPMTGLQLPQVVAISVVSGDPLPLGVGPPSSTVPSNLVPVPVIPDTC